MHACIRAHSDARSTLRARSRPSSHRVPPRAVAIARARRHRDRHTREFSIHASTRSSSRASSRLAPQTARVRPEDPRARSATHPIRVPRARSNRRRIVVTHRSCSSPPRASRSPIAICVGGGSFAAPRARGASSSSSPRASSPASPSSSEVARRGRGRGDARVAIEGVVCESCLVDRSVGGVVRGS